MILRAIDNLNRGDHFYLTPEDQCMFLREYTTGGGWQHSDSNQLILNLKKSPSLRLTAPKQHYWKERAIDQAAGELRQALNLPSLSGITFVPIPPSKSKTDPEYDDRLETSRLLKIVRGQMPRRSALPAVDQGGSPACRRAVGEGCATEAADERRLPRQGQVRRHHLRRRAHGRPRFREVREGCRDARLGEARRHPERQQARLPAARPGPVHGLRVGDDVFDHVAAGQALPVLQLHAGATPGHPGVPGTDGLGAAA